ncbi:Tn3 family transposase [Nonomuraea wenchangensis]|uniref:Tn3 family transposase n=1 Tax=Nonomuraea wenchangensis TaxID=568860 RepID=UPI003CCB9A87
MIFPLRIDRRVAGLGRWARDSLYILDTLINIDAGPQPEVLTTDQASDSDTVFGIFSMLGYRFAPRFADLGDQRFWRAELPYGSTPAYGPLDAIARNKINRQKIHTQWSDMTRVSGSMVTNQATASPCRIMPRAPQMSPAWARRGVAPRRSKDTPAPVAVKSVEAMMNQPLSARNGPPGARAQPYCPRPPHATGPDMGTRELRLPRAGGG